jgi:hypothetical protein
MTVVSAGRQAGIGVFPSRAGKTNRSTPPETPALTYARALTPVNNSGCGEIIGELQ